MDNNNLNDLSALIAQEWEISVPGEENSLERLRQLLSGAVAKLLNHNPERLAAILYRLDVSESLFQKALSLQGPEAQASQIAELILQREAQRLEIRKKYSAKNKGETSW